LISDGDANSHLDLYLYKINFMQKSHQKENTIPLNDLSAFYRQFSKREKMTASDIKEFSSQIPSDNYFRIARTEDAIPVLGPSHANQVDGYE
jgi:hypothetical protein